jgi:hypothetical protein
MNSKEAWLTMIKIPEKEELDMYHDTTPIVESHMNETYEVPERRRHEELPPAELKTMV